MLCELKIENVAVIEQATVRFTDGLNVLSGETGAGKSILIDSINAILGNRTSREMVRSHTSKARIWATFSKLPSKVCHQIEQAGYEVGDELLLYREIGADGKSICRVNGMPATASAVRSLCSGLIAIHGQHDNQSLMDSSTHLGVLDAFAQNQKKHEEYYTVYRKLCKVKKKIDSLEMDESEKEKRMELLRFQCEEIEMAQLTSGEEEELVQRRDLIRHAQKITEQLTLAYQALDGADENSGAAEMLGSASSALESIRNYDENLSSVSEKLSDLYYVARDVASDIANLLDQMDFDSRELDQVEERLDLIYRLKQKYGQSIDEILTYFENARKELHSIETSTEQLEKLYQEQADLYEKAKRLADVLTQTRMDAFQRFNEQITEALAFLNMPGIRFVLHHQKGPLASSGQDQIEFYISTNAGEEAKSLAKIASGGELSRILLAVKSALADKDEIGTVIYDEIDTGVSGLAAGRIGEKLKQTSQGRQVICITHTAQIAAFADEHLLIQKHVRGDRTFTEIHSLDESQRVKELARIISGDNITEIALANAREMMQIHRADQLKKSNSLV